MTIKFNKKSGEFHLYNKNISYIFNILENNHLGHLYFGKRIRHRESFEHLLQLRSCILAPGVYEGNLKFSLETIKQEYPSYGTTDFRNPAFQIEQKNGSRITNFEYQSHKIYSGKPKLKSLPATYVEDDMEATTLEVKLEDKLINMELILTYTIFEEFDAICRSVKFKNNGKDSVKLKRALSMTLDMYDSNFEMLQLDGAWSRERHINIRKLSEGIQSISSARGASSANHNPFIALKRPDTNENNGEVYGFSLVYSGNFLAQVEVDNYNVSRVIMGINPFEFGWTLDSNEEFQTPEVVMVYSSEGLNKMSQTYHNLYRKRLARGVWRDKARPILINNWEATYFDFNEEKILNIAKKAKDLGIELFVLDDGWFGKRNDDTTSLGDWVTDYSKLPNGIEGLATKIVDMGLKFGLWFEPEMVNKISNLYENHPEWIISTPNRAKSHGRNQYVLDFTNEDVIDYVYSSMSKVLKKAPISYVKWDMNRNITEAYSSMLGNDRQEELFHRYILGVYKLYERLTKEFPEILFESCASGGGRFDAGLIHYAPQGWASDNTDAVERLKIQYGTSIVYPISSIGTHVSAIPNHQVDRKTSIEMRANVAYFGTFGYELDLNKISKEEQEKVIEQIKFFKKYREIIQYGDFYRLKSPFENNGDTSWMVVSKDKKIAIVGYYKVLAKPNPELKKIKLKGLDENLEYECNKRTQKFYGDELMNIGLLTDMEFTGLLVSDNFNGITDSGTDKGDFTSQLYIFEAK